MMYIKDSYLILENEILYGNFKIIEGKIATIEKTQEPIEGNNDKTYILAGFIDQHIHGACSADTMDSTLEALEIMSKSMVFLTKRKKAQIQDCIQAHWLIKLIITQVLNLSKI